MQAFEFWAGYPNPLTLTQIPVPDNWQALTLELSFENGSPEAVFNATKLVFKGSNAAIVNAWLEGGLTGGVGIFEGIPLQIKVCPSGEVVFDGIIDLTDAETKFACDIVQVRIRDKRMDMVNQLMDSVSFAYLASLPNGAPGKITPGNLLQGQGDYLPVAYQRNDIPDYESYLTLILVMWDIYQISEEIVDAIANMASAIAKAAAAYPAVGLIILFSLEALLWLAYIIVLTIILFSLMKAAVNCLIAPVLTKFGMYAKDLMQKACDYFGLQFQSTIFSHPDYSRLVVMPVKPAYEVDLTFSQFFDQLGNATGLMEYDDLYNLQHGGDAFGYYEGTCGQFIRSMEDVFNAKAKIILNTSGQPVLHFERWDFQYILANYQMPNISDQAPFNSHGPFNSTGYSQSAFKTNADEIAANYGVKFALDDSDLNTYNYYDGNSCFCTTRPATVTPGLIKNVTLQHLKEVNLEFAHVKRKDQETGMEKLFASAYSFVVTLADIATLGIFSSTLNITPSSFNLVGHMHLSQDTTGVPKMFIAGPPQYYSPISISNWNGRNFTGLTIDPNNKSIIGARTLFKNFHFSNLPKTVVPPAPFNAPYTAGQPYYNQWLKYESQQIPLCCADYDLVKNNNIVKTFDSRFARVDSLSWNPFKGIANLDYRIQTPYTQNLITSFIIDGVTEVSTL